MSLKYLSCPSKILSASISSSATSFKLNNIEGWDGVDLTSADFGSQAYAVIRNANNTILELIEFDPTTIASASITIVRRGLKFTGDLTTEVAVNKLSWTKGDTYVDIGVDTPQMLQWLQEYIDAAIVAGGVPATTTVLGLSKMSVAPASAASPIAVGDNDPRVPTLGQAAFVSATTGMIVMFGSATPPTGFLLCNGQAVSRTTYADLFAVCSTSYGVGDGSTTFNVPDLQSRFPLGYSASAPTKVFTFASRSSDTITITGPDDHAQNELQTGQAVLYDTTGTVITGLSDNTTYYLIRVAYNQFKLATSVANANKGTAITLSSDGTGTQTFTATYTVRPVGQKGGTETATQVASHTHQQANATTGSASGGGGGVANGAGDVSITGGNTPNNMPLFTVVNYIIKT